MLFRSRLSLRLPFLAGLAALAATALFLSSPAVAAPTAPQATTTTPAVAAAGWLAQQFVGADGKPAATGDHFDYPPTPGYPPAYWAGLTASGVFALAAAKVGADKIDQVLAYMAAHAKSDANIGTGMSPGPYDGSVATYALAAEVSGSDPADFGPDHVNLLQALADDECTSVSAPASATDYTTPTCPAAGAARNIFSSVSESLAILAQARGGQQPSTAAVTYFLSLQCRSGGGFTGLTTKCTDNKDASVDETAYAVMALQALGGHAAELNSAVNWLLAQRSPAGYWTAQGGPDVDSTGLAAAALDGVGKDVSSSRTWLASQQVTDGPTVGAGASRGALKFQGAFDASSSIKATADGILGLAEHASLATLTASGAATTVPVLALAAPAVASPSVRQGGAQTITGTGFAAHENVSAVLHSTPVALGTVRADASGTVRLRFTVPRTLAAGPHTVVLTGRSGLTSRTSFTVTAAPAAVTTPPSSPPSTAPAAPAAAGQNGVDAANCDPAQLACTGRDGRRTHHELLLGVGLVLLGGLASYAGRRRRRS